MLVTKNITKIGFLDGVRGFAALWVVIAHVLFNNAVIFSIFSDGAIAVDIFMVVSGFLMTYHYFERRDREPWEKPSTWIAFWVRRIFRIAPVYYVILFIKIITASFYASWDQSIGTYYPQNITDYSRYFDISFQNIFMHLSFLFGLDPYYSRRSPGLPDWSISLETQFYLILPFLALLSRMRGGLYALSVVLVSLSWSAWIFSPEFLSAFSMPSFLGLKIHIFLIGMILAYGAIKKNQNMYLQLMWILLLATAPLEHNIVQHAPFIRYAIIVALFLLVNKSRLPELLMVKHVTSFVDRVLSHRICVFMADMSYSVYLIRMFFVIPVSFGLMQYFGHEANSGLLRSAIGLLVVIPLTYACAWVVHNMIEIHGIKLGRVIVNKFIKA